MRKPGKSEPGAHPIWPVLALPACGLLVALGPDSLPLLTIRAFLLPGVVLLLITGVLGALRRHPWTVDGAVLAALICAVPLFLVSKKAAPPALGHVSFSVAQMNVHQANTSITATVATARSQAAELLTVQEVDARWEAALRDGLADLYPYAVVKAAEGNYGIALFSRIPLEQAVAFDLSGLPAIQATIRVDGVPVLVLAIHLRSPESALDLNQRNQQWASLEHLVDQAPGQVMVVGDLNTVPWDDAALRFNGNTSMGWGPRPLLPTWPSIAGFSLIPLDHVLTSPGLHIQSMHAFVIPGSDHQGVSASLAIVP